MAWNTYHGADGKDYWYDPASGQMIDPAKVSSYMGADGTDYWYDMASGTYIAKTAAPPSAVTPPRTVPVGTPTTLPGAPDAAPPPPIDWASRALGKYKDYFSGGTGQPLNTDQITYYETPAGKQDAWTLASQQEIGSANTETPWARWLRGRDAQAQTDFANKSLTMGKDALQYHYTDYINDQMPELRDEYSMFSAKAKGTEQRWQPAGRAL